MLGVKRSRLKCKATSEVNWNDVLFDEKSVQLQHSTIRLEGSCSFTQESHRKQACNVKGRVFYSRVFAPIFSGWRAQRNRNGRPSTSTQTTKSTEMSFKLGSVQLVLKGVSKQNTRPHYIPNLTPENLGKSLVLWSNKSDHLKTGISHLSKYPIKFTRKSQTRNIQQRNTLTTHMSTFFIILQRKISPEFSPELLTDRSPFN